ncbi:unnamed protein product [Lactuca saligna]|uniref:Uncharacterized protein n=1 Tax=Lactuca saligna TaxID=75948 RepID=A0AA35V0P9_LACSI|nr:unnamed protein product [Lactuca saligna]
MTQVMHASVRSFIETNFASLIYLDELDLEGLRQLCRDLEVEDNPPEGDLSKLDLPPLLSLALGSCMVKSILFQRLVSYIVAFQLHIPSVAIFGVSLVFGLAEFNGLVFPTENVPVWTLLFLLDDFTKV